MLDMCISLRAVVDKIHKKCFNNALNPISTRRVFVEEVHFGGLLRKRLPEPDAPGYPAKGSERSGR